MSKIAILVAVAFAASCSNPSDNNTNVVVVDEDMSAPNNTGGDAAMPLDVNNGLTPDAGGCQVGTCPANQVCNTQTGVCVDCLTNAECGANGSCDPVSNKCSCDAGYHLCDGACLADDSVESCGTSCEACPTDPNGTATCDGASCGLQCNAPLMVDPNTNACVGCTSDQDCTGPDASVCGASASCEPCVDAAGCDHITGRPTCDAGSCVECTTADDSACGGNSCDPFSGSCTLTPKESVDTCAPCLADSECMPGYACVPMQFQGDARAAGFCLPIDNGGCAAPYPVSVNRTSLSGVAGSYCTLNEDLTTCEGVADYFAPCADDSDCGADGLDDGVCEPVDFEFAKCTFLCDAQEQCPTASLVGCATGDVGVMWCGAF